LGEWQRVRDWRVIQLHKLANVEIYLGSDLSAGDIRDFEADHIVLATGSTWRADGVARATRRPLALSESVRVHTPDDILRDRLPEGDVIVYEDDHYYMGAVAAEM
jgi:dimethylamine/trimethylamine dehydrogenase